MFELSLHSLRSYKQASVVDLDVFGLDVPPRSAAVAAAKGRPAKQLTRQDSQGGARPRSPNLLGHVQRGFKALIDGEAYISERDRAASKGLGIDETPASPEPSFLNKVPEAPLHKAVQLQITLRSATVRPARVLASTQSEAVLLSIYHNIIYFIPFATGLGSTSNAVGRAAEGFVTSLDTIADCC